jgi:diguanylate cyclase (GGDEF)-like protein
LTGDELKFRAALSRFGVGLVALVLLPLSYPLSRRHIWVWIAYLSVALFEQVLIRKRIGGDRRALWSGMVDLAALTFTCHNLGSVVTPMSSLYLFAGVATALVTEQSVAFTLAVVGPLAFDAVVTAEWLHWIPFAPDVPELEAMGPPSLAQSLMSAMFVSLFVPACTVIVVQLRRAVRYREELLVTANHRLEELSQQDPLTALYNRRYLFDRVENELARVRRGHPLSLLMIDLDSFKKVNDSQGHLRGDVLLKEIAEAVAATTRKTDVTGRYGGDEFMIVLPDTDATQARAVAERVAEAVRATGSRFDAKHPVTASLGLAIAETSDTVASLLRRADENAYRAKQGGGDRVVA